MSDTVGMEFWVQGRALESRNELPYAQEERFGGGKYFEGV